MIVNEFETGTRRSAGEQGDEDIGGYVRVVGGGRMNSDCVEEEGQPIARADETQTYVSFVAASQMQGRMNAVGNLSSRFENGALVRE